MWQTLQPKNFRKLSLLNITYLLCCRVRLYESTSPGGFFQVTWRLSTPELLRLIVRSAIGAEAPQTFISAKLQLHLFNHLNKTDCWHTCPSLHWYRCVQIPAPSRHGDYILPSRCEHIERALPHVRLHLARVYGSVTWKMAAITQKPSKLKSIHLSLAGIWRYHGEWWGSSRHVTQKGRGSTWRWATSQPSGECGDLPLEQELQASFTHIS